MFKKYIFMFKNIYLCSIKNLKDNNYVGIGHSTDMAREYDKFAKKFMNGIDVGQCRQCH